MAFFDVLRERTPSAVCAVLALVVRVAVVLQAWALNPVVRSPRLDGDYYQRWATDIARGDVFGTDPGGLLHGDPFFLNPLYAYVIAPIVGVAGESHVLPVLLLQSVMGAATAGLAAAAADRYFGRVAAWTAGLAVALSAVLVQLDAHLSVSGLAAFLVAGLLYSLAPSRDTDTPGAGRAGRLGGARGPFAAGIWLGLGALARPVVPLALPFIAWLHVRRARAAGRSGWRAAALVAGGLALLALPSLARNWTVSGEPVLFTAANGANLHLGNNPLARKDGAMTSKHFRFSPFEMHEDARLDVQERLGRRPTWGEVSAEYRNMAVDELIRHPVPSLLYYGKKARWFLSPVEVPSSASLWVDRDFLPREIGYVPLLWIAFVPTWLLVALGFVGAALHRRRADVLLGPVALVGAHVAALVLAFPLSHYRSPAVPALAVLAGGALQWAVGAWRGRNGGRGQEGARRRQVAGAAAAAVLVAAVGALPPQPAEMRYAALMTVAASYRPQRNWDRVEEYFRYAQAMHAQEFPDEPPIPDAHFLISQMHFERARRATDETERTACYRESIRSARKGLELVPEDWENRMTVSVALMRLGRFADALEEVRVIFGQVGTRPDDPRTWKLPPVHARYGECLVGLGRPGDARVHFEYAIRNARGRRDLPVEEFLHADLRRLARARAATW